MMKNKLTKYSVYFLLTGLMFGCYPQGAEYYDELDLVYSNYASQYDFTAKNTYAIPDKIVKFTGDVIQGEEPDFIREPYNTQILALIRTNMSNLGWTEVSLDQNPDVILSVAAWELTTTTIWYDYWYYWDWWYGGYYPPYYGGWYPYYPMVTSYSTGTLLMFMSDPNAMSADDRTPIVWTSAINGLLQGNYSNDRITRGVNQAFTQSPYLNTK
jgi:hypothetical protein